MAKGKDRNHISVPQWMLIMLLSALPCIGIPFLAVGAFAGNNETRKNYCRAVLMWWVLGFLFLAILVIHGSMPEIMSQLRKMVG